MIHNLTTGFLDRAGMMTKPLDMRIVRRLLDEVAEIDAVGSHTLGGWEVQFQDGCVILPGKGGTTNRVAEALAVGLQEATGCTMADREHGRVIDVVSWWGSRLSRK